MGVTYMQTVFTSAEFNRDAGKAKQAADYNPVFITKRGVKSHVILNINEYTKLSQCNKEKSLVELLAMPPGYADIDVDFNRVKDMPRRIDF